MTRIDAHLHFPGDHPASLALIEAYDLKLVNVCVATMTSTWHHRQAEVYRALADAAPARYAWLTAFDLPGFDDPDYADRICAGLDADFAAGAVGVKVWKDIGIGLKTPDGEYVQLDHPVFEPIWAHLERAGIPLLMHIGEPRCCWEPLDPEDPHYGYYSHNPQWHMHGRTDFPHHREIMAGRDRMVAAHPKLLCIGAHLASLEWDVDEVAARLEAMPNFVIDTSARLWDLMAQDPAKVRAFFERYADRILWGTDAVLWPQHSTVDDPAKLEDMLDQYRYLLDCWLSYLETPESLDHKRRPKPGLALGEALLEKVYVTNAERVYPGLVAGG